MATPRRNPVTPPAESIADRARAAEATRMILEGHTYDEVAQAIPYANRGTAHRAVQRHLNRHEAPDVEALRKRQNEVLLFAQKTAIDLMQNDDAMMRYRGVLACARVDQRIASLNGLDLKPEEGTGAGAGFETPEQAIARGLSLRDDLAEKRAKLASGAAQDAAPASG